MEKKIFKTEFEIMKLLHCFYHGPGVGVRISSRFFQLSFTVWVPSKFSGSEE
jgi:hypothetical protein